MHGNAKLTSLVKKNIYRCLVFERVIDKIELYRKDDLFI